MKLRILTDPDDPLFPRIEALYEASFPEEERDETAHLREEVRVGRNGEQIFHLVAAEEEGRLLGFARGSTLLKARLAWGLHLAVDPTVRSRGLGSALTEAFAQVCLHDAQRFGVPVHGLVLEVERPTDARTPEELAVRERRERFFTALGAEKLTETYVQPPAREGFPPVSLALWWLEAHPGLEPDQIVRGFYKEAFGLPPKHVWVQETLQGLAGRQPGSHGDG